MVFYPLHWLPFWLVALGWRVCVVAALYAVVRVSQQMIDADNKRVAMLWTAGAVWLEPILGNIQQATVGVFLMLAVLHAAYSSRWWLSGLLVGVGAGVKLTPATAGVYFVGMRRWAAAVFSGVVFFATLAVSYLVAGDRVRYYFTEWIGRNTVFPIGSVDNQSWRGGIARVLGYDAGMGPQLVAAIAVTAALGVLAWWVLGSALQRRDRLGSLLVVMLFGLLASPVSWTNHWVWIVPLLIWLLHGPWLDSPGARVLWWIWLDRGRHSGTQCARAASVESVGDQPPVVSGVGRAHLSDIDLGNTWMDHRHRYDGPPPRPFVPVTDCSSSGR